VCRFEQKENKLTAIVTDKNKYPTEEVVIAAGAWSGQLAKQLHIDVSLEAGKGYRIDVHRETGIKIPAILMEAKVAVTPMKGFYTFCRNHGIIRY
jgi:D-amino-acid dehydrogenase